MLRHHHRKTYHANHRFYEEGYNDGLQAGTKAGFAEGREFGVQTGYQRFLDLGLLQGRVIVWEEQVADLPESKQQKTVERLQQIKQLIHQEEPTYFYPTIVWSFINTKL